MKVALLKGEIYILAFKEKLTLGKIFPLPLTVFQISSIIQNVRKWHRSIKTICPISSANTMIIAFAWGKNSVKYAYSSSSQV